MELTKSQERRLAFVASLLSLNPNDPTDRIKALRHLNLDENGCFHGFQYSQGFMEFFIFLDEDTPLEKVVSHLNSDLKQLQIAVFRTSANLGQGYPYHQFNDAADKEEFDAFVAKIKELSLYDTGLTAEYGDKLLTLSTCEYTLSNGRFVVVAKRIS